MKAAIFCGPYDIQLRDLDEVAPPANTVKVRVEYCGICGTDLLRYQRGSNHAGVVPGHELCGEIVEVGPEVRDWHVGDWVVVNPIIGCGKCHWCQRHLYNRCSSLDVLGATVHGGFAEYVLIPQQQLCRLPSGLSPQAATLVEPFAVALHALRRGHVQIGESAAVVGDGAIGLFNLLALRIAGVDQVFFVGKHERRKELSKQFGATVVFDHRDECLYDKVAECTKGVGVDISLECVGSVEAVDTCMKLTRSGGRVVIEGNLRTNDDARTESIRSLFQVKSTEICLIGSFAYDVYEFESSALLLANRQIPILDVISSVITLDEIVCEGYDRLLAHKDQEVKIIVKP